MKKVYRRLPKNYDGNAKTFQTVGDILPMALSAIHERFQDRPDLIISAWPDIVGPKIAAMARVQSFLDGILHVKVNNSTLLHLLSQHEKHRIMVRLREKFPSVLIKHIYFRIG